MTRPTFLATTAAAAARQTLGRAAHDSPPRARRRVTRLHMADAPHRARRNTGAGETRKLLMRCDVLETNTDDFIADAVREKAMAAACDRARFSLKNLPAPPVTTFVHEFDIPRAPILTELLHQKHH